MFDTATARKSLGGEIANNENRAVRTDLIVLKGGFSTSDHRYNFEIKSDGAGVIFYTDFDEDSEEFAHEIKVEKLAGEIEEAILEQIALQSEQNVLEDSEIESIREETVEEMLEEVFWEEINQTLEDPFFRSVYDDGEWGEEFQTTRGTVDEFVEFLELCVLTEREILPGNEDYLVVEAETEFESAGVSECSYYTNRLGELVEIACEYYKPSGFRYDYNDGCYDRYSGYSTSSESVSVSLSEAARAPVREKMLANVRLREKLALMEIETVKS
jgi:5S rRNA maturation endonuclease (ribonuclease M5)